MALSQSGSGEAKGSPWTLRWAGQSMTQQRSINTNTTFNEYRCRLPNPHHSYFQNNLPILGRRQFPATRLVYPPPQQSTQKSKAQPGNNKILPKSWPAWALYKEVQQKTVTQIGHKQSNERSSGSHPLMVPRWADSLWQSQLQVDPSPGMVATSLSISQAGPSTLLCQAPATCLALGTPS